MKRVLILCTGNSCRSQMAEGYLKYFAGNAAEVYSAGIETHGVNPKAISAMKADGIDISAHTSDKLEKYEAMNFDFIITVCDNAKERCPYFPSNAKKFHHNFPDPAKAFGTVAEVEEEFIRVREMIKLFCREFVVSHLKK